MSLDDVVVGNNQIIDLEWSSSHRTCSFTLLKLVLLLAHLRPIGGLPLHLSVGIGRLLGHKTHLLALNRVHLVIHNRHLIASKIDWLVKDCVHPLFLAKETLIIISGRWIVKMWVYMGIVNQLEKVHFGLVLNGTSLCIRCTVPFISEREAHPSFIFDVRESSAIYRGRRHI